MKIAKELDSVKLKDQIQAALMKEYDGLRPEEIRERRHRKLATSNSPIAKLWRSPTSPPA